MVVYFIVAIILIIVAILFGTNKWFSHEFRNNPYDKAKNFYRVSGTVICAMFAISTLFLGLYDLSKNLNHKMIALEGIGLFTLLFAFIGFIFSIFIYHNMMIDYSKAINTNEEDKKKISEDSKQLEDSISSTPIEKDTDLSEESITKGE